MTAYEKTVGQQMTTWQIGESGTELVLDGDGEGEVTFTITNTSELQDRAVLTVTPLDGAADDWFTVDEPQRAVGPGASVVYAVEVKVPPGTAAGSFGMQGEPPTIVEDPVVLQTATADPGVWSEEDVAFEFQWQRCDQGTATLRAAGFIVEREEQGTSTGDCDPVVLDQRPPRETLAAQAETVTIITRPAVVDIRACDPGEFDDQIRLPIRVEDGTGPIPEEFTRIIVEEAQ